MLWAPACARLHVPDASGAAAVSAGRPCQAVTPARQRLSHRTIIFKMPPTPALFMPPKKT